MLISTSCCSPVRVSPHPLLLRSLSTTLELWMAAAVHTMVSSNSLHCHMHMATCSVVCWESSQKDSNR
jgi:hypothetical protein